MSEEILLNAISYLDEDIVGDYVKQKLKLQEREKRRKSTLLTKISLVAAAFVLVFSAVIIWQSGVFERAEAVAPDMSKVVWAKEEKPPHNGICVQTSIGEKDENGLIISSYISSAFYSNSNADTVFAIRVKTKDSVEKTSKHFQKIGVYCEVKNEIVFIFVTEEEFGNMRLNFIQKKKYSFDLARKSDYENNAISYNTSENDAGSGDNYSSIIESTYSDSYNKIHISFNEDYSDIDDEEELISALEEIISGGEEIWITVQFLSEFGKTREYLEYANKKSNGLSREEAREMQKELYNFSFQYHKAITDKGAEQLSFIDYDEIIAYDYSPFLLMKVYDISLESLLKMIEMDEIVNVTITNSMNVQ